MGYRLDDFVSIGAAAKELGVTYDAIRKRCVRGSLKRRKIAGYWMLLKKDVEQILKERKNNVENNNG